MLDLVDKIKIFVIVIFIGYVMYFFVLLNIDFYINDLYVFYFYVNFLIEMIVG